MMDKENIIRLPRRLEQIFVEYRNRPLKYTDIVLELINRGWWTGISLDLLWKALGFEQFRQVDGPGIGFYMNPSLYKKRVKHRSM